MRLPFSIPVRGLQDQMLLISAEFPTNYAFGKLCNTCYTTI